MKRILTLFMSIAGLFAWPASCQPGASAIPEDAKPCLEHRAAAGVILKSTPNPFYLRGDFDGNGRPDYAFAVKEKHGKKQGILICRSGNVPEVLAAGKKFRLGDDLPFDTWQVYRKRPVQRGVDGGPPPKLIGEAILLIWEEKASGLIYWTGRSFAWYQQGD